MNNQDIFEIIRDHDESNLAKMIEQGLDVNFYMPNPPFWTPLQEAIDEVDYGGKIEIVKLLIKAGADVNAWNLDRDSHPLLMAMWGGHKDIVSLLLKAGANPNVKDNEGNSPLRWSVEEENIEMVQLLLNHGAKDTINEAGGFSGMNALGIAVSKLNIPIIKTLLDRDADPEVIDNDYRKPIERLPKNADTEIKEKIKRLLVRYGAKEPNVSYLKQTIP
ncbi:ankyrin repeat domain-containing protein [Moorena bouillonii]|nr:ankyrin repeat domain-containing protein [Moorena bouillonii]NEO93229.1 ankyrin repeat domain-containing protein [Moorena sp. SIO3G5]NEQ86131.1 ankyrin repeat domain-containing protein [Moorena sp. SIO2I5]